LWREEQQPHKMLKGCSVGKSFKYKFYPRRRRRRTRFGLEYIFILWSINFSTAMEILSARQISSKRLPLNGILFLLKIKPDHC